MGRWLARPRPYSLSKRAACVRRASKAGGLSMPSPGPGPRPGPRPSQRPMKGARWLRGAWQAARSLQGLLQGIDEQRRHIEAGSGP
jgi:hypothetical protein